jgi:FtsH-binding integral membrane protein
MEKPFYEVDLKPGEDPAIRWHRSNMISPFEDKILRRKFIRRTYLIVLLQLLFTFGMIMSFTPLKI